MSVSAPAKTIRVALLGNPNTGKTTLFNALTGYRARVGNYPGVTVEKKTGPMKGTDGALELIDLPGTYSLSARSADEMIAVDVLTGNLAGEARPDAVLIVTDASNLERNLFLATQVMELRLPTALILNMVDVAEAHGVTVDSRLLGERLGVPVFTAVAAKGKGIDQIVEALHRVESLPAAKAPDFFPEEFGAEVAALGDALASIAVAPELRDPFLLRRALLEADGMAGARIEKAGGTAARDAINAARARLAEKGLRLQTLEARSRYGWIRQQLDGVLTRPETPLVTKSDRIDAVLIHKVWGTLIFAALMMVVFQAIYSWAAPIMDLIEGFFGFLGDTVDAHMAEGPLRSFLVDGVIGGVGGVVVFVPQIMFLFFFIALLEDCGYMARAAFLMDRLLSRCGLSGRSFIPMLSSFACAVPGIMATRTIEDRRDRLTTILVAPLMSCSARLPVYTLFIGAFVPRGYQAFTLFAMYALGVLLAIPVALLLKRTLLRGKTPAFLMELPAYKAPHWPTVLHRMVERGGAFLARAGTIIFSVAVIIWALTYYPRPASVSDAVDQEFAPALTAAQQPLDAWLGHDGHPATRDELEGKLQAAGDSLPAGLEEGKSLLDAVQTVEAERDHALQGAYLRQSFLGRGGHLIEPVVRPLGWDWKIGMAALASFPAREVIIATLGIIYDLGGDVGDDDGGLIGKLQSAKYPDGRPVFSFAVALSIMVFFALCCQCAATLAIIKRETNSWRWPVFAFAYMTALAYIGAMLAYQIASRLG